MHGTRHHVILERWPISCIPPLEKTANQPSHQLSSNNSCGDQYSFSRPCASTHTTPSATRSSMTVCARGRSQCRFSCSMEMLTKPRTWMASRTVAWSVLSSLGTDRMYCLEPTRRMEKPEPSGSRDLTAWRMSSLSHRQFICKQKHK